MNRLLKLIVIMSLALSATAHAEPYFDATTLEPTLIPAPLMAKSPAWNAEVEQMIALQKTPDPEQLKQAAAERDMSPEMVAAAVEPKLTRKDFPAIYALLDRVGETSKEVVWQDKRYWNTQRPYLADSRVKSLINAHDNPAYPSGHTCGSYVWAVVLGEVVPEKRAAFLIKAEDIGQRRVLVGQHYPHDVVGGRQLSFLVVGALSQNPAFQKDLEAARAEWNRSK